MSRGVNYVEEKVSKSLYAKALMSPGWKQAAKKWRNEAQWADSYGIEFTRKAESLAASRLKLLGEVKQLLDVIYAEDIVSSGDLGKVYEKVVEELGNDE